MADVLCLTRRRTLHSACEAVAVARLSSSFLSFTCSPWTRGLCIGATGNNCRKRHFYQEGDRSSILPASSSSHTRAPDLVDFSSPLVVKVRREVARERREEVDLETGNRRSWIESVEFDMLDLTGRTKHTAALFLH